MNIVVFRQWSKFINSYNTTRYSVFQYFVGFFAKQNYRMSPSYNQPIDDIFGEIVERVAQRQSPTSRNLLFYKTMRDSANRSTSEKYNDQLNPMGSQKQDKDQSPNKNSYSFTKRTNPQDLFSETYVTFKNARYHLGSPKKYKIRDLQFPTMGKNRPRKNRLNPLNEELHFSKQLAENRSRVSDASHLKMSWNKYMNITGFKRENQRKNHIEETDRRYVNHLLGRPVQSKNINRLRNKLNKDRTEYEIQGWNNMSYFDEEVEMKK